METLPHVHKLCKAHTWPRDLRLTNFHPRHATCTIILCQKPCTIYAVASAAMTRRAGELDEASIKGGNDHRPVDNEPQTQIFTSLAIGTPPNWRQWQSSL